MESLSATELRIGNIVNKRLKSGQGRIVIGRIGCEDFEKIFEESGSFIFEPTPLTVEKLIEFGFEYKEDLCGNSQDYYNGYVKNGFRIALIGDEFAYWIDIEDYYYSFPLRKIKYCHKLQNLYFEIKDEELI